MTKQGRFSFSAMVGGGDSGRDLITRVRAVERMGYTSVSMVDHFNQTYSPVPALTAAALSAPSLRVLGTVFNNDLRNPVLFAKEMATLDQLSAGRLDVGIGAGWLERDYTEAGIAYDAASVRIERLDEALQIMKRVWSGETFSFEGQHYTVKDHTGYPLPAQQPHPPIYIGGGGRKLLTVAARHADIIGIHVRNSRDWSDERHDNQRAEIDKKLGWIRDAAGERFDSLRFALLLFAAKVIETDAERDAEIARIAEANNMSPEAVANSPYYLVGTAAELVDELRDLRDSFGISHFTVGGRDVDRFAPVVRQLAGM